MSWIGRIAGGAAVVLALAAVSVPAAGAAGPEFLAQFGEGNEGHGAGQTNVPRGVATDPRTGRVFVADQANKRIDQFTAWGAFVKAFGWDVAPGAVNEQQEVRFKATAGQFELTFGAATTAPLQFDAGAEAVKEALDGLSSIGGADGEVAVTLNPSSAAGVSPYVYTIAFKGSLAGTDVAQVAATNVSLSGGVPSTGLEASTRANGTPGGTGLEDCTAESGCQLGAGGPGAGQLGAPEGIAVDSAGDVFVVDLTNRRVQKFNSAGEFLLMFGGGVDSGGGTPAHPGNLCTAEYIADGDTCGAGSTGTGPGEFGGWNVGGSTLGSFIAVGPADKVYVGDEGRIQRFNAAGEYQASISEGLAATDRVKALAADAAGNLYASICEAPPGNCAAGSHPKANVREWNPSGTYLGETVAVADPFSLAADSSSDLYVFSGEGSGSAIVEFNPAHSKIAEFGQGEFSASTGIGTNTAGDVYASNANPSDSFIRAYGPEPSTLEPAPDSKPEVGEEYATSVSTTSAVLKATIVPHFWSTRYYLQYGPEECETALTPCIEKPLPPGSPLGAKRSPATATVAIEGLSPGQAYHFRFVAESEAPSSEGHPSSGEDKAFKTFPNAVPDTSCPNQSLREGPGAQLPDCRGYEMVSPVDKNGGDVNAFYYEGFYQTGGLEEYEGIDQATPGGAKLTYTASTAFGEPLSSPLVSQYLAARHQGAGGAGEWTSEGISASERGGNVTIPDENEYKAFSPDLGTAWLEPEAGNPLAPCATEGYKNLYRVKLGPPATYTATCSSAPEPPTCIAQPKPPKECLLFPEVEGYSADQSKAVFRVQDRLTPEAAPLSRSPSTKQVYEWDEGELRLVSTLPDGSAYQSGSSAGTESEGGQAPILGNAGNFDTVEHAMSADGSRVYWSTQTSSTESAPAAPPGPGRIFMRLNADKPQSAFAAPGSSASGAAGSNGGGLSAGSTAVTKLIAAAGTATLSNGSNELSALVTTVGEFVAGQPIEGNGIPAGTTITTASATTLTLSAAATKSKAKVEISSKGPQPFAVGQRIVGAGIPAQTTIAAVGPGTLTLSAAATKSTPLGLSTALSAFSECSEAEAACTLPVSEAVSEGAAKFWDATPSGSEALFSFFEGPEAGSLYRYDLGGEEATLIAKKSEGVLGASEDLSRIYFASEELCGGGNDEGKSPSKGRPNVYLYQPGESCAEGTMTFLGTLVPGDISTGSFESERPSPVASVPRFHVARVSANGLHLAFVSAARLGAYDNADAASGQADREVYLYDATANEGKGGLLCASCNPSGARPAGVNLSQGTDPVWTAAWINSYQYQLYGRRMLSEDGKRLFFNSYDALTPRDTNGTEDVYEWEALGAGPPEAKCAASNPDYSAQDGGCVSLISAGTSPRESEFVDASADGSDVFFRTESSLDPRDPGLVNIYDARVGGGTAPLPSAPAACEGEACQSPPGAPGDATPASSAFHGPGNAREAKPSRCPKGKRKVRNHGKTRCVQKHKRQAKKRKRGAAR